jgi:hypothetical protein
MPYPIRPPDLWQISEQSYEVARLSLASCNSYSVEKVPC